MKLSARLAQAEPHAMSCGEITALLDEAAKALDDIEDIVNTVWKDDEYVSSGALAYFDDIEKVLRGD